MRSLPVVGAMAVLAASACGGDQRAPNVATSRASLTSTSVRVVKARSGPIVPRQAGISKSPVEEWRGRYPGPARLLDEWRSAYPSAAALLTEWERENPEKLRVLVMWGVTYPHDTLGVFFMSRPGWDELEAIWRNDPRALDAFLHWIRESPPAAEELTMHYPALLKVAPR